jgi:hypothetical protein
MYKVHHRQPLYPDLVFSDQDPLPAATSSQCLSGILDWPTSYQEVAQVEAESLEEVYFKTQHLETTWWHNREVKALQISRTTSVGDVIQDENNDLWAVATTGFVRLSRQKKEVP